MRRLFTMIAVAAPFLCLACSERVYNAGEVVSVENDYSFIIVPGKGPPRWFGGKWAGESQVINLPDNVAAMVAADIMRDASFVAPKGVKVQNARVLVVPAPYLEWGVSHTGGLREKYRGRGFVVTAAFDVTFEGPYSRSTSLHDEARHIQIHLPGLIRLSGDLNSHAAVVKRSSITVDERIEKALLTRGSLVAW